MTIANARPGSVPALELISRAVSSVGVRYHTHGPNTGSNPGGGQIQKKRKDPQKDLTRSNKALIAPKILHGTLNPVAPLYCGPEVPNHRDRSRYRDLKTVPVGPEKLPKWYTSLSFDATWDQHCL